MKLMLATTLLIASTIASANTIDIEYASYKDLMVRSSDAGSYSWTSQCKNNDLYWDKEKKTYKRKIESDSSKGTDIVEVDGDTVRTITTSVDSYNTRMFMDTLLTFTGDNTYTKTTKRRYVFPEGVTQSTITESEGEYKDGKFIISKLLVNGEVKPINKGVSTSVWLDKDGLESIDAFRYEYTDIEEKMNNPNIQEVLLRSESSCTNISIKN